MDSADRAIAIVGVGAILPDAPSAAAFWNNIVGKRYSISDTPPDRWSIADYYDPDPKVPDKTYSKIGGWVKGFEFDWRRFRMPPKVAAAMDEGQQWAVTIAADALADYGYPERPLDTERTGVILGTAMGGELHYITSQRIVFPEYVRWLKSSPEFQKLSPVAQAALIAEFHAAVDQAIPPINEDSMPGELPNIVSGRVANVLNLRGPNFITDAACASSFAAVEAAIELLTEHKVDAVIAGGVDRNMGATTYVKFCKIGALSATGTRPFGDGADGFVMGEGAGAFLLKRLEDAERAGDKIYAVIRGVGGASDGKGKGITAPNPVGQRLAMQRAWEFAGLDPATATLVEAHGTSTRVGDVVEVESLTELFSGAAAGSIGLGSAKSNIGHLKAGAGAAGLMKATLALHHKILPPTLNANPVNPNIDLKTSPFYLLHEAREWEKKNGTPRRAGVSAYGFGGTNFHLVMEEHVPGMLTQRHKLFAGAAAGSNGGQPAAAPPVATTAPARPKPVRGILALGANSPDELKAKLDDVTARAEAGWAPPPALPKSVDIRAKERLVIDFGDHEELVDRLHKARKVMSFDTPQAWKAMEAQGIFRGSGPKPGKLAFLFPGQGSQYVNMGRELAAVSPTVQKTLDEADAIMQPVLGRPLSTYIFIDPNDKEAAAKAQFDLMQTEITQPAMLTLDEAIRRLLADYGFEPDMVMGHSLGEYGALVAAGVLPFNEALEAAAGRGREMARVKMDDNGWMAAVLAPYEVVEATLTEVDGYVVPANINSNSQSVIGGESKAVEQAIKLFQDKGYQAMQLPVSHAFHTRIVAPASKPLRQMLDRMHITPPVLPLVANVTGDFYPSSVTEIKDLLEQQIASPVQWVKGLQTMYKAGVRTFVEVGPKRALRGFVKDVFGDKEDIVALLTNHPKGGELPTFNQALCGLYAAGYGAAPEPVLAAAGQSTAAQTMTTPVTSSSIPASKSEMMNSSPSTTPTPPTLDALAQALAQVVQQMSSPSGQRVYDRNETPLGSVVISGTGLGLPGANKSVMDPDNALRILRGEQFVDLIPERFRNKMVGKQITRLVKGEDGSGRFQTITDPNEVIKLAGRPGPFDLHEEYGVPNELIEALDVTTQLAIAAGLDALREAGIPLVQTFKRTSTGKFLPDRWVLPEALRDDTGVIFASAFPGGDRFADEFTRYFTWLNRKQQLETLEDLRNYTTDTNTLSELNRRIGDLRDDLEREPYFFDRRFIFRILAMGHSQFAQYIGARGPNTHVNAACASTAQGVAIAEDWIRTGRCRRVIVLGADDVTGDSLMEWVGAGFLAVGAVTTKDQVAEAALPFDKRRHGTILGMGACALVVESEDSLRERGMRGIVELLSSETNNSAFHGTRLDVEHIGMVMDRLVTAAERRFGLNRYAIAPQTVFMSHETFTPARGGSAAAEIVALRRTFGEAANSVIMANTKGFTGHPMGVGVEDVIAVKILEYGIVPPVPNFKEVDPELGPLNLSRGGRYPVQYAIHLAAGFGSQIAMTFTRRIPGSLDRVDNKPLYQRWLADISGYDTAETEVVKRVLRIASNGNPPRPPVANRWQPGTGPTLRALVGGETASVNFPARMIMPATGNGQAIIAPPVESSPAPVTPKADAVAPATPPAIKPAPVATPAPVVDTTPVAPAPAPAMTPAVAEPAADSIEAQVIELVAKQTGYPSEMLDLDLDLEADLGIDTVKQAETFAAIRQAFDIPRRDDLRLRDYPTLGAVIGFVKEMRPELAAVTRTTDHGPQTTAGTTTDHGPQTTVGEPIVHRPSSAVDPVTDQVLEIVAGQTGYPVEMLDLDLDLEADLGIDTVKQAETFAAIRQAFDIPRRDDLRLRDYPTLGAVIGFVKEMRPELAAVTRTTDHGPQTTAGTTTDHGPQTVMSEPIVHRPSSAVDPVTDQVLEIVAGQTGYPKDMLELDLDLEADLGIDTVKQAETFMAIRQAFDIPRRDDLKLRDYPTLGAVIGYVRDNRPDLAAATRTTDHGPQTTAGTTTDHGPQTTAGTTTDHGPQTTAGTTTDHGPQTTVSEPIVHRPSSAVDPVTDQVLEIVAGQTGYPKDMLELDLDLEADLGIDTVKQAETFMAIRQAFDIPRRDDLKLRDYPTLGAVIGYVRDNRPDLAAATRTTDHGPQTTAGTTTDHGPQTTVSEPIVHRPSSAVDPVTDQVLEIVAGQTGYPKDMLELDLDLEADLGIDTVKQAETFMAIRQAFDIPRRDDLKLRDYPTLGAVIGYVRDNRPDLAAATRTTDHGPQTKVEEPIVHGQSSIVHTLYNLADADTMPRRVPVPSLRPSLDLCKPTSVTLDQESRVVLMHDRGGVGKALATRLEKLGVTVLALEETPSTEALEAQLQAWLSEGPIQGVYWLPALDTEPNLEEMDLATWRELNRGRVKNLYTTMRTLYDAVSQPGTFLVSATRLGGLFGYGADGATAPLGGGVAGFTKAYKRERGEALVKIVDFEAAGRKTAGPADALLAETLSDPGVVEIGYWNDHRYTVTLVEEPAADGGQGLTLDQNTVFLVTGAAGGITSAIISDLAAASGGTFYLLDLVPEPARDDRQIALFRSDKDALKQHLIAEAKARGEKVTPAQIDKQIMGVERNEAALRSIESVEAAGGKAFYRSVNLLDGPALAAIVNEIREQYGRIDVLVHAGGIEISRSLPNKDHDQFSLVYDIKVDGFFSLLKAAKGMPIGATVSFSSVAGRFGNNGQTDYSAANDLLCKITSSLRQWRPETKGIVIDWTAWGDIGMATRGSIPKIMEMAGIDMLPPAAGVPTVRRELVAGSFKGEIVVGGRLGILVDEWDETGGLDPEKANAWLAGQQPPLLMLGRIKAAKLYGGLEIETTLDPKVQPFLYDHAMDGTPLLPGVMGTESFGQLATALAPGYRVAAVFDEQFHAPFKFYRMEPQTLHLSAIAMPLGEGNLVARATLQSVRDLGKPGLPPQEKVHFTGKVLLAREIDPVEVEFSPPATESLPITAADVYRIYFHGPAYQVLERVDVQNSTAVGLMAAGLPPNTAPAGTASVMAPRLIELCFQTAGVWDIKTTGTMALPLGIGSVTTYRQPEEANGQRLYALVEAIDGGEAYNATVVDESGNVYVELKGYRTVDLPGQVTL